MTVVYAIFYVCRLAFSAAKKDMIEQGMYTTEEIGWVGSSMLIAYAIGKCVNGFIADRANITRFMGLGLFASALINFLVGFHLPALVLIVLWFVNGWTQGMGATGRQRRPARPCPASSRSQTRGRSAPAPADGSRRGS